MIAYENYKVLIVDDELDILKALNRDLRKEPYEKLYANTGDQAIKMFETETDIAVVVTDMRMPGMNGLQLLERIHALSPDALKIVLTGYTQLPQILATVNKVDIFKFLTKPWDLEQELKVYIKEAIDIYVERKEVGNQIKSQEQKTKMFNKMLIESYEKADFLSHLFEEFSHAVNYHHILSMQEIRKLKPDDTYETNLRHVFAQMKERMYFMNHIFDMSKFGVKVFNVAQLEVEILSVLKKLSLDTSQIAIKAHNSPIDFRDNFKLLSAVFSDLIQTVIESADYLESVEIAVVENEIFPQIKMVVTSGNTERMVEMRESKGKFLQQALKVMGGKLTFDSLGEQAVTEVVMPVKAEKSVI